MVDRFVMNGYLWRIQFVNPSSVYLVDRTGTRTIATTDPKRFTIYISSRLRGEYLVKVLIHEIGHCALVSFGLLGDISRIVRPEYRVQAEEWVCNFFADYGMSIFRATYEVLGDEVWSYISSQMEQILQW